jgi:hypothetical protein
LQELIIPRSVEFIPGELPGRPPAWLVLRVLNNFVSSDKKYEEFDVQESPEIWCISKAEIGSRRDAIAQKLQSGQSPYVDLKKACEVVPHIFADHEEAKRYLSSISGISVFSTYAVSESWTTRMSNDAVQSLEKNGRVDVVVSTLNPLESRSSTEHKIQQQACSSIPEDLRDHVMRQIETSLSTISEQVLRVGNTFLTAEAQKVEQETLKAHSTDEALSQWQNLKANPEGEIKFSAKDISARITNEQPLLHTLIKDRTVSRAVEDSFWCTVATEEEKNETQFADFWTERALTKCHIYKAGLMSVEDQKLQDQLSELLGSHLQKELLVETITKARTNGLVLSRKTRKNLSRFETILKTEKFDLSELISAIEKFNKKQGMDPPDNSALEGAKKVMVSDMVRRMQKQKSSDGPVLFLTLVLVLFSKHYGNVLYATGKFAPKLLKQLKAVLPADEHEKVEKWKEAAKTSSLSAEDRAEMKSMAEA